MEGLPGHPLRRRRRPASGRADLLSRRLLVLRHGRTSHNLGGRIQGQLDIDLDEVGRAQAQAAAHALAPLSPYAVIASDLARARDTAIPVAAACGVPLQLDQRLRELDLGAWQGLTAHEAQARFPQEHAAWRDGVDVPRGGGETYAQAGARALACVLEVVPPPGDTLLVVTHGGTARALLGALLGLPAELTWRLAPLGNTCWSTVVEAERGWRLERHNAGVGSLLGRPDGASDLGGRADAATL